MLNRPHSCEPRRRSRRIPIVVLVLLGVFLTPTIGVAETPAEHSRALCRQAEAAYIAKRPLEALAAWRAAFELEPTYEIACNIGRIALRHASVSEAATFLARCSQLAKTSKTPLDPARTAAEQADFTEARRKVAALRISISQPGAQIAIDGTPVGISPLGDEVFVLPGEHRISAQFDGFAPATQSIQAQIGETRRITLNLTRPPAPLSTVPSAPAPRRVPWPAIATMSAAFIGLGLGIGFTFAANSASTKIDSALPLLRDHARSCNDKPTPAGCSEYKDAAQSQATFRSAAVSGFVGAGLAGIATTILLFYPKAPVKPVVGTQGGLMVSLW